MLGFSDLFIMSVGDQARFLEHLRILGQIFWHRILLARIPKTEYYLVPIDAESQIAKLIACRYQKFFDAKNLHAEKYFIRTVLKILKVNFVHNEIPTPNNILKKESLR